MAPWRTRDVTMVVVGPGLIVGNFLTPAICQSGVPERNEGMAGIADRICGLGRITMTAPPEGID